MNGTAKISVLVAGLPANIRQLTPRPGESPFQCIIRNHGTKWRNFLDTLKQEHGLPDAAQQRFLRGAFVPDDKKWGSQIEFFMNAHTPTAWRTLEALAGLRDELPQKGIDLAEILWMRTDRAGGGDRARVVAQNVGARIVVVSSAAVDSGTPYGYVRRLAGELLGDFVWIVPGGTRFLPPMTAIGLASVIDSFMQCPTLAMFFDEMYTVILRTAALSDVLARGMRWPEDVTEQARVLSQCGFKVAAQHMPLVELEPVYGGENGPTDDLAREFRRIAAEIPVPPASKPEVEVETPPAPSLSKARDEVEMPAAPPAPKTEAKTSPCKQCGHIICDTDWVCPNCGHTKWDEIMSWLLGGLAGGAVWFLFLRGIWRWVLCLACAIPVLVAISEIVSSVKVKRRMRRSVSKGDL